MKEHLIVGITQGSPADIAGIKKGERLISLNGKEILDIFDYDFIAEDENVSLVTMSSDGEEKHYEIEKEEDEELGLLFEESLMDNYKSCYNKCIFCFIDQNPQGMRETIYFKDDDSRLSFLQGNYITMTNMKDSEIDRIIEYKLAPINISVHTTNPELRCSMLHNRFAGRIMEHIEKLYKAEIPMNAQIVLCKGVNDGEELLRSLRDLAAFAPVMGSVSVVPVGLTKYRDGLCQLDEFNSEDAEDVIDMIEDIQKEVYDKYGIHFAHASDEWYIMAGREIPSEDNYDGYNQLENGVGMTRLLYNEFTEAVDTVLEYKESQKGLKRLIHKRSKEEKIYDAILTKNPGRKVSTVCGLLSKDNRHYICKELSRVRPDVEFFVYPIENKFFGPKITVTGLLTGSDIVSGLQGCELGDALLIPSSCLKADEDIFLDDMTLEELKNALQVETVIVKSYGMEYLRNILGV
ncbi:MAG TPA: radical SAM protein [Lachnospiraceae bacterium]|nr:radical SAM protein [Lachnospiraceae bacterium]